MDINSIIMKKRSREILEKDDIKYFIGKYLRNEISEAQAAALMSYIYVNGITEDEITKFAIETGKSGDILDLSDTFDNIIDCQVMSVLGDKITLLLLPIIAALGISVTKIYSKNCEDSDGVIDKLLSIPGFNPNISMEEFKENVKEVGASVINQDLNLAPVERKLYNLRNEIACKDSIALMAISLMSLEVATGSDKVIFDLSCGKGTYLKKKEDAKRLGKLLVKVGKALNKKVGYIVTLMDEPVGNAIGNVLEIKETIKCLKGNMPKDVEDTVVTLASLALALVDGKKDMSMNAARVLGVVKSGQALTKFKQMVMAQNGNADYIESIDLLPEAKYKLPVYATESGYISKIDVDIVESLAKYLEVIKTDKDSKIDNTAGIIFEKKIGDEVKVGEILAYIYANDESKAVSAVENLSDAYKYTEKPILAKSRVLEIYGM